MKNILHVGIDDTDSPKLGCTTYVAAILVEELERQKCEFIDYPNLIRLNPNIPWKTRGNGAVCLRFKCPSKKVNQVIQSIVETVKNFSDLSYDKTDPSVSVLLGEVPKKISNFTFKVIRDIATVEDAIKVAESSGVKIYPIKGRQGIVGCVAALGEVLKEDYTYELISYRTRKFIGTSRKVNFKSILSMDRKTKPYTFNNYDKERRRILLTPHGPDPILYGIRGEEPHILVEASRIIILEEPIERWVIFRTNHGTDMHYSDIETINESKPFRPVVLKGTVAEDPKTITGSHSFFKLEDNTGKIECAAYEPTGSFRGIVKQLIQGDKIKVYGGVKPSNEKHPTTLNLEKIEISHLASLILDSNPLCDKCGKRMESAGRGQGYRCRICKTKKTSESKILKEAKRKIQVGLNIPTARAHRHLTKPKSRYGFEKKSLYTKLIDKWHDP
jgi:tRNA(Ile2)-agmatinylcytidine synthase